LLAATYRAALGEADFALHLAGQTGAFKSEIAALCQQHFGAGMNARNFPGSWSSTANAIEAMAFYAKDALFVIDDFPPQGSTHDVARYHASAVTWRQQVGGSAIEASKIAGHSDLEMTGEYTFVAPERQNELTRRNRSLHKQLRWHRRTRPCSLARMLHYLCPT
jgi:hypothetical protein